MPRVSIEARCPSGKSPASSLASPNRATRKKSRMYERALEAFVRHCNREGAADKVCLRGIAPPTGKKMITLRAIKGIAPNECRYHRLGESYDFCMWASETGGESLRKAPSWLQADAMRFGPIRKTDCESCPAFAPMSPEGDET
jgi:hypothetical protein